MPTTDATADPAASAAHAAAVQELAQIESESQQQQCREQADDQHVYRGAKQTLVAGLAGARQGGADHRKLTAANHVVDVSTAGRDTDRRQRRQQQPDDALAAIDARLGSVATVVVLRAG